MKLCSRSQLAVAARSLPGAIGAFIPTGLSASRWPLLVVALCTSLGSFLWLGCSASRIFSEFPKSFDTLGSASRCSSQVFAAFEVFQRSSRILWVLPSRLSLLFF